RVGDAEIEHFKSVISTSPEQHSAVLNYVVPTTALQSRRDGECPCIEIGTRGETRSRVAELCVRRGLAIRVFFMPLTLGTTVPCLRSPAPLDSFLCSLHGF